MQNNWSLLFSSRSLSRGSARAWGPSVLLLWSCNVHIDPRCMWECDGSAWAVQLSYLVPVPSYGFVSSVVIISAYIELLHHHFFAANRFYIAQTHKHQLPELSLGNLGKPGISIFMMGKTLSSVGCFKICMEYKCTILPTELPYKVSFSNSWPSSCRLSTISFSSHLLYMVSWETQKVSAVWQTAFCVMVWHSSFSF